MQSAFTIAVLGDVAKRQPLLHKAPAPNRAGGRVEQVPGAIRIDVALLADDKIIAAVVASQTAHRTIEGREQRLKARAVFTHRIPFV